jgi:biopolymer transport protein TolR
MARQRRLMNEINVVPYIDVMLVLLVIFMVTAPMIQHGTVELPSVAKSSQATAQPLEVMIEADGDIRLTNRAADGTERAVSRGALARTVREIIAKNPEQPVLIAADKKVRYEVVMGVMDELQRAQVQRIGLLVQSGK